MIAKILTLMLFPLLGGLIPLAFKRYHLLNIKAILSFGGTYLLCVGIVHMIPEAFSYGLENVHTIGLFILLGFIAQLLLEQLSHGMEHGHQCHHHKNYDIEQRSIGLLISLAIHSFLESIPLAYNPHNWEVVIGIGIHHIPVGLLLTNHVLKTSASKRSAFIMLGIFMFSAPAGYLLGFSIFTSSFSELSPLLTAFSAGIILYIATIIILESSSSEHKFSSTSLIAMSLGIAFYFIIKMIFEHTHVHHHTHAAWLCTRTHALVSYLY